MTAVFYCGLAFPSGLGQVAWRLTLAARTRRKSVRKTCLQRALTAFCPASSCAGHVIKRG